jgi:hypothetical protein
MSGEMSGVGGGEGAAPTEAPTISEGVASEASANVAGGAEPPAVEGQPTTADTSAGAEPPAMNGETAAPESPTGAEPPGSENEADASSETTSPGNYSAGKTTETPADGDQTTANEQATAEKPSLEAGRLPIPPIPPGTTVPEFGNEIMQWGSGSEAARERIETLGRDWLVDKGVTREMAESWRDFYVNETERNPDNPSAHGRADLMEHAAELLRR